MKASEYIKMLQALVDEHGDLPVFRTGIKGNAIYLLNPRIGYKGFSGLVTYSDPEPIPNVKVFIL